ncbi:MAG: hypothetical protein AAGN82_14785 [Myxococcota bacterium]
MVEQETRRRRRRPRAWWVVVVATAAASGLGAMVGGAAGCSLPRGGNNTLECAVDAECDDQNPCTVDRCGADGFCAREASPAGLALPQVAGDCLRSECGPDGTPREVAAADDVPDDANPCTVDRCAADGTPTNDPTPRAGEACTLGPSAGTCDASGTCVVDCTNDADCDDGNGCTDGRCDLAGGTCRFTPLDGVVAPDDVAGDCVLRVCAEGQGADQVDDTDLPDDGDDCTRDGCNEGVPTFDLVAAGSSCSDPGDPDARLCDPVGACVACLSEADCTGIPASSACATRVCTAGQCGQTLVPPGTAVANQTTGDCVVVQCDGAGGLTSAPDPTDIPGASPCESASCVGTTPTVTSLPAGTACGVGGVCNGAGSCGACNGPTDCGTDTECRAWSCVSQTCVALDAPSGTPLSAQIAGDCVEQRCDGTGGVVAVPVAGDPFDDNNECTDDICLGGMPLNPFRGTNDPCSIGFCNGAGTCVECNGPGQCPPGDGVCESAVCDANNQCGIAFDALGTMAPPSEQTAGDCLRAECDGMGNVAQPLSVSDMDVPDDGDPCTDDVCTNGVPSNPPAPAGTTCPGGVCDGAATPPGPQCVACVDDTTCPIGQVCNVVNNECVGGVGAPCISPAACITGICADGVCCVSACGGGCEACDQPGNFGLCLPYADGLDPELACAGPDVCNGFGGCRCGDGVVNGAEVCDANDPFAPCCAANCLGPAGAGVSCGMDPDGAAGCMAAPVCDGLGPGATSCVAQSEPDGTACGVNMTCTAGQCL